MKFKSRRSIFTVGLVYLSTIGLLLMCYNIYEIDGRISPGTFVCYCFTIAVLWMGLSIVHNTTYEIKNGLIYYRSGIVRGSVAIDRIREIIKGKTMYAGLKPAAASKGLIIKYDMYEEIYISPDTNDSFVEALLKIKSNIAVTQHTAKK